MTTPDPYSRALKLAEGLHDEPLTTDQAIALASVYAALAHIQKQDSTPEPRWPSYDH